MHWSKKNRYPLEKLPDPFFLPEKCQMSLRPEICTVHDTSLKTRMIIQSSYKPEKWRVTRPDSGMCLPHLARMELEWIGPNGPTFSEAISHETYLFLWGSDHFLPFRWSWNGNFPNRKPWSLPMQFPLPSPKSGDFSVTMRPNWTSDAQQSRILVAGVDGTLFAQ